MKNFDGSRELPEIDSWVVKLERIFDVIECSKEDKLSFATYLLDDRV